MNTGITEQQFVSANPDACGNGGWLAHETKHSEQWAIFCPLGFPIAYGLDTLQAEARATLFGCPVGQRKCLEE